jgi:hypothetical protein
MLVAAPIVPSPDSSNRRATPGALPHTTRASAWAWASRTTRKPLSDPAGAARAAASIVHCKDFNGM